MSGKSLIQISLVALLAVACQKETPNPLQIGQLDIAKSSNSSSVNLTNGLMVYYPFSGNANDASGNGYNGVVTGATLTKDRSGYSNKAYHFNGVSGTKIQTQYSGILGANTRSVSLWAKRVEPLYNASHLLTWGKPYNSGQGYSIFMQSWTGGVPIIAVDNGGSLAGVQNSKVGDGKWHNYSFIYDQNAGTNITTVKVYIDGVFFADNAFYNTQNINTVADVKLVIGEFWSSGNDPRTFNGDIDDIRIYNRALTQSEITYLATH